MSTSFLFFFQAEDGIRYPLVTGVQTCALPISAVTGADAHFCRQPLPARTEVDEQHVTGVRSESGQRLGQRPEVPSSTRQRQAPVVHDELDRSATRLERNLNLAEVVVRVRIVKREAEELLDDRAEPPLVLSGDSDSGCKGREECQYQRLRARVAEDGDLYPRHGKRRMLEADFGPRLQRSGSRLATQRHRDGLPHRVMKRPRIRGLCR